MKISDFPGTICVTLCWFIYFMCVGDIAAAMGITALGAVMIGSACLWMDDK